MRATRNKRKRRDDPFDYAKKRIRGVSSVSEARLSEEIGQMVRQPPPKSKVLAGTTLTFPSSPKAPLLPKFDGPKMRPFRGTDVEVCFLRDIGNNAMHSNVFEVLIDARPYALKLFKTYDPVFAPETREWNVQGRDITSTEMWSFHKPFNCECRAYGRMTESGISDRFWRCYGYVRLPAEARQELYKVTGLPAWYWQVRLEPEWSHKATFTYPHHLSWPIYGLVKELAPRGKPAFDPKVRQVRSMRADLRAMHEAGILNKDLADRNYILGRLIDFSHSFTMPHIWMRPNNPKLNKAVFKARAKSEVFGLGMMLYEHGIKNRVFRNVRQPPSFRQTRGHRRRMLEKQMMVEPLYELGFSEPTLAEPDSDSDSFLQGSGSHHLIRNASTPPRPKLTPSGRDFGES